VEAARPEDQIRLAELMAALSLATDLGLGQHLEHELGVCLSAVELADRLGCTAEESSHVYYVALLAHVGCAAAAPYLASWWGAMRSTFRAAVQVLGPRPPSISAWAPPLSSLLAQSGSERPCVAVLLCRRWQVPNGRR
jgi:hypothetical protein